MTVACCCAVGWPGDEGSGEDPVSDPEEAGVEVHGAEEENVVGGVYVSVCMCARVRVCGRARRRGMNGTVWC